MPKVSLKCFTCKQRIDADVLESDIRDTKNGRLRVSVVCPNLKPDGSVCGRKMGSLVSKNILKVDTVSSE